MNGFSCAVKLGDLPSAAILLAASICFAARAYSGQPPRTEVKPVEAPAPTGPKTVTVAKPVVEPAPLQNPDYVKRLYARYDATRSYEYADKLRESEQWNESFKAYAKARELYESIGEFDDAKESEWSLRVGRVEQARGNLDAARDQYQAALESDVRRQGEPSSQALVGLGYLEYSLRRYEAAQKPLEEAVEIDRRDKKTSDLSLSLQWLAAVRRAQGDHREAAVLFREASDVLREFDRATPAARAEPLRRLSRSLLNLGELPEALATAEEAATLLEQAHGATSKETVEERRHVAQIAKLLGDHEQRRHLPHEFARLQARFFEHSKADAGKKRFYDDRSWSKAFEKKPVSKTDKKTDDKSGEKTVEVDEAHGVEPSFPDDGRLWLDPAEFRTQMIQAASDVTHIHDLSDAAMDNLREVLAGLEAIDGNDLTALEYLRAARSAKARNELDEVRILNHLIALECQCGDAAAMLDFADELFAYTHRFADLAHRNRADTASACDDPAQFERCRRYLELARTSIHKSYGVDHWRAAELCESFVYFYARTHDPRALDEADRMIEIIHDKLPADAPLWKYVDFTRATAYLTCGETQKAEPMLESLLATFRAEQEPDTRTMAVLQRSLARIDAHRGRADSARRRYDEAISLVKEDRHLRNRLRSITRERDDFLAGKLTPPTTFD